MLSSAVKLLTTQPIFFTIKTVCLYTDPILLYCIEFVFMLIDFEIVSHDERKNNLFWGSVLLWVILEG